MRRAVLAAALLAVGSPALAHGTGARTLQSTASAVEFYYTDGEPMAYAEAKVFSPAHPDAPFVNGRADRLGRVTFLPDSDGTWRVEVRDNEGHHANTDVLVTGAVTGGGRAGGLGTTWPLFASLALNIFAAFTLLDAWRRGKLAIGSATPARWSEGMPK